MLVEEQLHQSDTPAHFGGELVDSAEVIGFKFGVVVEDLLFGHSPGKPVEDVPNGDPQATDARLARSIYGSGGRAIDETEFLLRVQKPQLYFLPLPGHFGVHAARRKIDFARPGDWTTVDKYLLEERLVP